VKKTPIRAQSATSLPQAPTDDADARFTRYMITMGIRLACIVAMVLITPYGWYTWVLAIGAVFLPYIAVVIANVGADTHRAGPENPERMLESPTTAPAPPPAAPDVIRITETPRLSAPDERDA
jgi:hypothetical protein